MKLLKHFHSDVPVLSYLANSINSGERSTPYSLVTAVNDETLAQFANTTIQASQRPPIVLNDWTARDLNAKPGDTVSLEYYLWHEDGRLETKKADFQLAAVVPIQVSRRIAISSPSIRESPSRKTCLRGIRRFRMISDECERKMKTMAPVSHHAESFHPALDCTATLANALRKLTSIRLESPDKLLTPPGVNAYGENLRKALDPA